MDNNITAWLVCLGFVIGVFFLQYVFYGDEISYIFQGADFVGSGDAGYIPFISDAAKFVGWAFLFIQVIFSMLTLDLATGMPMEVKIIFLIPFWGALGYLLTPIILKTGEVIARGVDAIIPF